MHGGLPRAKTLQPLGYVTAAARMHRVPVVQSGRVTRAADSDGVPDFVHLLDIVPMAPISTAILSNICA